MRTLVKTKGLLPTLKELQEQSIPNDSVQVSELLTIGLAIEINHFAYLSKSGRVFMNKLEVKRIQETSSKREEKPPS